MMSFTGSTRAGRAVAKGRRRFDQAGGPGARRQVAEHRPRGRGHRQGGQGGHPAVLPEQRPVLQRADADARAGEPRMPARSRSPRQPPKRPPSALRNRKASPSAPSSARSSTTRSRPLIAKGIEEGAELVTGGTDRPEGMDSGYYVRPTVFGGVSNDMTIAQEEILRPRALHPPLRNGGRSDPDRQRHARTASPATSSPAISTTPAASPRASAPATSTSTAPPPTSAPPSAATSSPATAASGATSASRSSWRSRP